MIFNIAAILIILSIVMMLINAFTTSQYVNKFISLHSITSYIIVFICLIAILDEKNNHFVNVAIVYAMISFIATVGFLKYIKDGCVFKIYKRKKEKKKDV